VDTAGHWDDAYAERGTGVSWFEAVPQVSLDLIAGLATTPDTAVLDVGGGASGLTDHLLTLGYRDLTVLDVSAGALSEVRKRLPPDAPVQLIDHDLRTWRPTRRYGLWHDRAALHFMVDPADRAHYRDLVVEALEPGGGVVIGTFAPDGPDHCSGLPVVRYSSDELMTLLGPEFELVEVRHQLHRTPAGTVQPFTWVATRARGS
jgi:Methyltransferase domain